jgi:TonB family protein
VTGRASLAQGPNRVSSAADTVNPGKELESQESGRPRPNLVAFEATVSVTGTKSNGQDSRELFSEETTTVLVGRDGAVIRLNAALSVGQLVFLTNKKTNQEVVCQILRKRGYKPTTCYVELRFTEARPEYWGVPFPEGQKSAAEFKIVEQVQPEEVTAEEAETPVAPHRSEDVDQLKTEVQALREQLKALEQNNVEEAAAKAVAEAAAARETAEREAALREAQQTAQTSAAREAATPTEALAPVDDPVPVEAAAAEEKARLLMPPAKEKTRSPRAVVGMALPIHKEAAKPEKAQVPPDPTEELLPEPELDFSQAPKAAARGNEVMKIRMPLLGSKARVRALLAVLATVVAGAILFLRPWRYLPLPFGQKADTAVNTTAPPVRPARDMAAEGPKEPQATSSDAQAGAANAIAADAAETKDRQGENSVTDQQSATAESASAKAKESSAVARPKKPNAPGEKSVRNKDALGTAGESHTEAAPTDAPPQPAKLLKAANPVYPPEAMANYITGDVKAEVEVDARGRVGAVNVISGPRALREAAIRALKQYEYAPATQGGKAIASTAVEVVKFWFDP